MGEQDNQKNEVTIFMRIDNDFVRKKHVIQVKCTAVFIISMQVLLL